MYDYPYSTGAGAEASNGNVSATKGISKALSTLVPFRRKAETTDATQENSLFTAAKVAAADRKKHPVDDGLSILTADEVLDVLVYILDMFISLRCYDHFSHIYLYIYIVCPRPPDPPSV